MSISSAESRRVAVRYARALFDLASGKNQLDAVKNDLDAIAAAYAESDDFRHVLESPSLSREQRQQGVDAVLNAIKAAQLTRDFFRVLAENRRMGVAPFVAAEFNRLLAESRNETTAEVVSAYALTAAQVKALQASLQKATGRDAVHVVTRENPEILGGVVVHVDGKMYDNSIATKINRLASAMKSQVQA